MGWWLFTAACLVAVACWDDYGIAWDEPAQREIGLVSYAYVAEGDDSLLRFRNRDYGVAFELPLIALEKLIGLEDTRAIYLVRHLVTHLFFLLGALSCFRLIDLLYRDKLLATAGFLLLVLHPVLYAHSFFNTKDIPFLSMTMVCLHLFVLAFRKGTVAGFVLLGIGTGLLINIRIMGVLLPLCAIGGLAIDAIATGRHARHLALASLLLATMLATLYATWPFLWTDPVEHFTAAFNNMSKFRWRGSVLFNGAHIKASELGWEYIPVWFAISNPLPYLAAGLTGTTVLLLSFLKRPRSFLLNPARRSMLVFLVCCYAPVVVVVALGSVLYDGWRQLFFIYAPFVLLAVHGLWCFSSGSALARKVVLALCALAFAANLASMVANHPFQHVYFNALVPSDPPERIRERYEMDYWGTSYKQALEHILAHDASPVIGIAVANSPGRFNLMLLPEAQRDRFRIVPVEDADYFITNHREHDHVELEDHVEDPVRYRFHAIKVRNSTINEVFKLK